MRADDNKILIAGMGMTGRSSARYFDSQAVTCVTCDDAPDVSAQPCTREVLSASDYLVKSPGIPNQQFGEFFPQHRLINDVEVFMRICRKPLILVTGTNGKSTVVALLEHILSACGIKALACGNYGVPVLDAYEAKADLYVIEVSSYQLENMITLRSLSAVVLNIGNDHLDRYEDLADYLSVKEKVYTNTGDRVCPINSKGEVSYRNAAAGYQYDGKSGTGCYLVSGDRITHAGADYISLDGLSLSGNHNYLNICAALCLCRSLALDDAEVKQALGGFSGLEHRMELFDTDAKGRKWINDSKSTNLHSLEAALACCGEPVCLLMGGQSKNEDYAAFFDEYASRITHLVLFGRDAESIGEQAAKVISRHLVAGVAQAVAVANKISGNGAVILFSPACSSFDQYENYRLRGEDFKAQVRRELSC